MQELLRETDLANLSCDLQKEKERDSRIRTIPIRKSHAKVCFGYLHRQDCQLRSYTETYLKRLQEKTENNRQKKTGKNLFVFHTRS